MQLQIREMVEIREYEQRYQTEVEQLVLPIQQVEFGVAIDRDEQPDLVDIPGTFLRGNGNFWLALRENKVVGCVGVVDISNNQVALKKMFVHRNSRGKELGISASLLDTAKKWCREKGIETILLGTTGRMTAAHRFYEKNGFVELAISQLPEGFLIVHVDTKFYRCDLI